MKTLPAPQRSVTLNRRPGFTLTEISVVMWVLAIVLMLGAAALLGVYRLEEAASASLNRLTVRSQMADQFRTDVAEAVAAPENAEEWTADATCLILRRADDSHVIYRWDANHVERFLLGEVADSSWQVWPIPGRSAVSFSRSGPGGRVVTWRLIEALRGGQRQVQLEITAALGGDVQ